jgi:hypothetical protein
MENYSWLIMIVVCCAFGLMPSPWCAARRYRQTDFRELFESNPAHSGRIDPASIIPTSYAREFPTDRIAKTLHGIWQGRITGETRI